MAPLQRAHLDTQGPVGPAHPGYADSGTRDRGVAAGCRDKILEALKEFASDTFWREVAPLEPTLIRLAKGRTLEEMLKMMERPVYS